MITLDVRSRREYEQGHVPGARHVPFWLVWFRASSLAASRDDPITVYCGHGPRAWMAKALLRARGCTRVQLLRGHMRAWKRNGQPLE